MAIQVINDPYRSRSASFGAGMGRSLGDLLQGLAHQQLQEYSQRKQAMNMAQGFSAMGVPEDVSRSVAYLPPKIQELFLNQYFGSQASVPGQELAGEDYEQQPEADLLQQQMQGIQPTGYATGRPVSQEDLGSMLSAMSPDTQRSLAQATGAPAMQQQVAGEEIAPIEPKPYRQPPQHLRKKSFKELLSVSRTSPQNQKDIDKSTKPSYDKILLDAKEAQMNDMRLNRMEQLNKTGKMTHPVWASLLGTLKHGIWGAGIDLGFLQSADSQEFNKLSKDFLRNAKSIFGARVTEGEIRMFLETIPTLSQTKEGRKRVIRNMKMMNESAKLRKNAMTEVIEANRGERPKNMELLIEKKIGKKLESISKAFEFGEPKKKKSFFKLELPSML